MFLCRGSGWRPGEVLLYLNKVQSWILNDWHISKKNSSENTFDSFADENEIKISEEICGILKKTSLIFTEVMSWILPNFGTLWVPNIKEQFLNAPISIFPIFSISDFAEPVSLQSSFQWKLQYKNYEVIW